MITDKNETIYLNIQNQKIPVWTYGNPINPPVIYVHGFFSGFSNYFGDLPIKHLMKNYFVVAFDLPGYGHSKDLKMDRLEFISEIQKNILKDKNTTILGISYGGLLSLEYYIKYPEKVSKIIIGAMPIFSGIFTPYKYVASFAKYKNRKIDYGLFKEFDFLNKQNLLKIKIPVLLYYSKSDFVANVWMGKKIHKMIPDSKLFITTGQNHQWIMDKIDKNGFLSEINNFLTTTS